MFKIAWSPIYAHPLPEGHRFPMEKYELLPEQLIYEGTIEEKQLFVPSKMSETNILLGHDKQYLNKLKQLNFTKNEIRATRFPLSRELVDREMVIMQGTLDAARYALQFGVSMNIAGGTHHAFSTHGEAFCLLNDLALAALVLLEEQQIKKALIVDLDVHQGNGTAQILQHESRVFTFSMHGANNYPVNKENSDLDISLADNTTDATYLKILRERLPQLIDKVEPDLILYQSGVDVLEEDQLGRLSLTIEGCKQRDKIVLDLAKKNEVPLVTAMGGGYSKKISTILEAHANTFRLASHIFF